MKAITARCAIITFRISRCQLRCTLDQGAISRASRLRYSVASTMTTATFDIAIARFVALCAAGSGEGEW